MLVNLSKYKKIYIIVIIIFPQESLKNKLNYDVLFYKCLLFINLCHRNRLLTNERMSMVMSTSWCIAGQTGHAREP